MAKKEKQKNNTRKTYFVQGMHCSTCEILIKQDLSALPGINKANVSLSKAQVTVHSDNQKNFPTIQKLNKLFKDLGYTFYEENPQKQKLNKNDVFKMVGIAILFVIAFYLLENSGLFMKYSISSQSSIGAYFVFGLAAGVSSCAALIGGLLLSLSKNWNELYSNNYKKSAAPFLYFNLSRILTFALLGGTLGYVGGFFKVSITLTSILTLGIAILMLILGLQMIGITWFNRFSFNFLGNNKYLNKNSDLKGKYIPLVVGALTFFVPCGFTLIAQTNTLAAGTFYKGMMQLGAFALGTLPVLALISFSSVKFYSNPNFSKKFSLFSGIIIVFFALYTVNSQLNVLGISSLNDVSFAKEKTKKISAEVSTDNGADFQVLQIEASGFEYYPKEVTIKSGVKTQWSIYNNGAVGCSQAVYARGLYPNVIYLNPGMNSVEFVAPAPGTYKISCSMGMVPPVTVKVI